MTDYISDDQPWLDFSSLIKTVSIGNGVKNVGEYAFFHMNTIKGASIGNEVETIGYAAFEGCDLSKINLPDSLTEIDSRAFNNLPNLTSIAVPRTVTFIGPKAFGYNNNVKIEGFTVYGYTGSRAQTYAKSNGFTFVEIGAYNGTTGDCSWKFNPSTGLMTISGSGATADYAWNNSTQKTDAPWWDYRNDITSVEVGNSVTAVGNYTFYKCGNLSSLSLGSRVKRIGFSAFCYCDLTELRTASVETIAHNAFSHNFYLSSVTMSDMVKTIENYAFYQTAISDITLSKNLTSIGSLAFSITNLTSVTIPEKVTAIGDRAFGYDVSDGKAAGFTIYGYSGTAAETYAFDNGFAFIPLNAAPIITVGDANSDGEVDIIDATTLQKHLAGLITLTGDNLTAADADGNGIVDVNDVTAIVIDDSVSEIGDGVFAGLYALSSVTIGSGVRRIGEAAFLDCWLDEVTIPETVENIGSHAFGYYTDDIYNEDGDVVGQYFARDELSIKGRRGSAAERYADSNSISFIEIGLDLSSINDLVVTINEPQPGAAPDFSADVPNGRGYIVDSEGGVMWFNVSDDDEYIAPGSGYVFEPYKEYRVMITLVTTDDDYTFAATDRRATLNDMEVGFSDYGWNGDHMVYVECSFICAPVGGAAIREAEVETDEPGVGDYPYYYAFADSDRYIISDADDDDDQYISGGIGWYNVTDNCNMSYTDQFEEGKIYRWSIRLKSNEFPFAPAAEISAKFNGKKASVTRITDRSILLWYDIAMPGAEPVIDTIGDIDGDGVVDIIDATILQKHLAGMITLKGGSLAAADADGSGTVDVNDVTAIQKYIAKIIDALG